MCEGGRKEIVLKICRRASLPSMGSGVIGIPEEHFGTVSAECKGSSARVQSTRTSSPLFCFSQ